MVSLDIGRVLSGVFNHFTGLLPMLLIAAVVIFLPLDLALAWVSSSPGFSSIVVVVLTSILAVLGQFWYQAVVTMGVRARQDAEPLKIGALFAEAQRFILPLIGAGILAGIGIVVGFILLIVPGVFLLTKWSVITPVIVIENRGILDSFSRSWNLVKGSSWQVFGVLLITFVGTTILQQLIRAIVGGDPDEFTSAWIGTFVGSVLTAPISGLTAAVLYFELRRLAPSNEPAPSVGRF